MSYCIILHYCVVSHDVLVYKYVYGLSCPFVNASQQGIWWHMHLHVLVGLAQPDDTLLSTFSFNPMHN